MGGNLRVLIVGSGGREHVLAWTIGKSPLVERVYVTPGNAGIAPENRFDVKEMDLDDIVSLALEERIDLVVVGPEGPLVGGLVGRLEAIGIAAFGPTAAAAVLEGSKIKMKFLCHSSGIPTAPWHWADEYDMARRMIERWEQPPVIKADGLCGGKGVVVAHDTAEALEAAHDMLVKKKFGEAGSRIVIEDRLIGREGSFMVLVDGKNVMRLELARDFKRLLNGDTGPNTGGMGAYSPLPDVGWDMEEEIMQRIIMPMVLGMSEVEKTPFRGLLYAGLMITKNGPYVLEFNVRFGDPETQVVLPRLESDIVPYLLACTEQGGLAKLDPIKFSSEVAVCRVLASEGYPGTYDTGLSISGLRHEVRDTLVFHAGTRVDDEGRVVTAGGRVMGIVGLGPNFASARVRAAARANLIGYDNKIERTDIALNI